MRNVNRKKTTWTTKDGKVIPIQELEDNHLFNILSFLQRCAEAKRAEMSLFYLICIPPQGDMASYYFEQEQDAAWGASAEDYLPDIYEELQEEALKRNLEVPVFDEQISVIHDRQIAKTYESKMQP